MNYVYFVIPAGNYAMFKAYGHTSLTQATRDYIYGTWLPNSGYERREGPDFEITDVMNSSFPDHMRLTIYIPVD
ncbi:Bacterial transcription activator, effector binding domain [compost metagenome]